MLNVVAVCNLQAICLSVCRKISEIFLVKDMSRIPNFLWFEYTSVRQETKSVEMAAFLKCTNLFCILTGRGSEENPADDYCLLIYVFDKIIIPLSVTSSVLNVTTMENIYNTK